jgi:Protein of unknown function (DUF2274)
MVKLRISALTDEKPVKVTVGLPAAVHRDLVAYADHLEAGRPTIDCRSNDACRADAGTIHGNGSCVQEAASWNSTKRFSSDAAKSE